MSPRSFTRVRNLAAAALLAASAGACETTGARSPETEQRLETFYEEWETEIVDAMADLDANDIARLRDVWPRAEFEGATQGVLAVLADEPALRPFATRLRRFLSTYPSNVVARELRTETVERRTWHILIDTVNAELAERPV